MSLRTLSIAAAVAAFALAPATVFAAKQHNGGGHASAHGSGHARTHVTRTHTNARVGGRTATRHVTTTRRVTTGSAHRNAVVHRNVTVNRNVNIRVGSRYNGGVWYGPRRHYWRGRWYAYGVGSCWLATPIGFVWVCGV